jgi:hypothetical protein
MPGATKILLAYCEHDARHSQGFVPRATITSGCFETTPSGLGSDGDSWGVVMMQQARVQSSKASDARTTVGTSPRVPARIAAMPIEPPHPREVADKLEFTSANEYKRAVQVADRYFWQAQLAVERRLVSVKKAARQVRLDAQEGEANFRRQVEAAQQRYRTLIEECHSKHRQTVYQAMVTANQAEHVYKAALADVHGYGPIQIAILQVQDARTVTGALVQAYKSALGPDGLGDLPKFVNAFDRFIDLACDRHAIAPLQFAMILLQGIAKRQIRAAQVAQDPDRVQAIKDLLAPRSRAMAAYLADNRQDETPSSIRTLYIGVNEWLAKAEGTPFELALERLKLDVDAMVRREVRQLENQLQQAVRENDQFARLKPIADAYQRARQVLTSSELVAKNVLHQELTRLEAQLAKDLQLAEATVIGLEHSASQRFQEAKRNLARARKLVRIWTQVLDELCELSAWHKLYWRVTSGFDHDAYWQALRNKQQQRQ